MRLVTEKLTHVDPRKQPKQALGRRGGERSWAQGSVRGGEKAIGRSTLSRSAEGRAWRLCLRCGSILPASCGDGVALPQSPHLPFRPDESQTKEPHGAAAKGTLCPGHRPRSGWGEEPAQVGPVWSSVVRRGRGVVVVSKGRTSVVLLLVNNLTSTLESLGRTAQVEAEIKG